MPTLQVAFVAALIGMWYWGAQAGRLDTFVVGTPAQTGSYLRTWFGDGTIWGNVGATLKVLIVGWAIGMAAGVALGYLLGVWEFLRRVADPFLAFFNGMPRLILYPFLAIWLGFELTSKVVFVALVIFVVVVTTVTTGFREIERELVDNVRIMGAGAASVIRDVHGPSLAIWVLGSARVTIGYAFQAAIAAEFVGASTGLGYLTVVGQQHSDVSQIWAALAMVVLIAWALDGAVSLLDRRLLRWMPAAA
jgi:ABC-type nitrate/sulfonate/bicarbonate transport system permease component